VVREDFPAAGGGAPASYRPGSRIASYILEEQVGAGGMAVVFRARDERLDRRVALKILAPDFAADDAFRQRFIRESRAAAAVDDPHIIPVFEAGEAGGVLFIAMRYVRGGDVRSLLTRSGPLPPGRVAEIVAQVSSALDAAHEHGLVHRDVKPANMLLDSGGPGDRPDHVYLSDFGLSKAALAASGLTAAGQFLGTLDYISPEQIAGKLVDGRADQYALACAAFELLTGEPPFRRDAAMAVMYAQLSDPPPKPTDRRPELPPAVDDVFARALAKLPADRYPSCRDFSEAMRSAFGVRPYESGEGTVPAGGRTPTQIAEKPARPGGPPTQLVPHEAAYRTAAPTEVHSLGDGDSRPDGSPQRRPVLRSPAALIVALIVLLGLGGGGYLATKKHARSLPPPAAFLAAPGCTSAAAAGKSLSVSASMLKLTDGNPFSVQVSSDGNYVFATTSATVSVLSMSGPQTVARQYHYFVASPGEGARGIALTGDGKDLAIAVGNGINVQSVSAIEHGASTANRALLTVPGVRPVTNADIVALSPGDGFAFVTLQNSGNLAVFNLHTALATGQNQPGAYIGSIALGVQPTGIAVSPDGQWLYVTSIARTKTTGASEGLISVLSMAKLETDPASALVRQATAGCSPARVLVSPDGKTVWVTARQSNELLGFSAARLRSDPKQALLVEVPVGQTPTGAILVDGGSRIIVADSDLNGLTGAHNLAVVDVAAAMAGKPALIGYIPSGKTPRDFALQPGGRYLYVSDSGSAAIQVVKLSTLP
jgi:serine/threonine protein kinase/DNA-binding beta-propeller fold protein YncE